MKLSEQDARILRQWNAFTIEGFTPARIRRRDGRVRAPSHNQLPFTVSSGRFRFARVTEFVATAGAPQTLAQIAKGLGVSSVFASRMTERAVRAGQVRLADASNSLYVSATGA